MNITELNGTELNGAGGKLLPGTLGLYAKVARASSGIALVGAEVTVINSAGEPAELYSESLDGKPELLEQPILTDNTGAFSFYAPFGTYTVTVTSGGEVKTLANQLIGPDLAFVNTKEPALPLGTLAYFQKGAAPAGWSEAGSVVPGAVGDLGPAVAPIDSTELVDVLPASDIEGNDDKYINFAMDSLTLTTKDTGVSSPAVLATWLRFEIRGGKLYEKRNPELFTNSPVYPGEIRAADLPQFKTVGNGRENWDHGGGEYLMYLADPTDGSPAYVRFAKQNFATGLYEAVDWDASVNLAAHNLNLYTQYMRYTSRNGIGYLVRWGGSAPNNITWVTLVDEATQTVIASNTGFYSTNNGIDTLGSSITVDENGVGYFLQAAVQNRITILHPDGTKTDTSVANGVAPSSLSADGKTVVLNGSERVELPSRQSVYPPVIHVATLDGEKGSEEYSVKSRIAMPAVRLSDRDSINGVYVSADGSAAKVAYMTHNFQYRIAKFSIKRGVIKFEGQHNPRDLDALKRIGEGGVNLVDRIAPITFFQNGSGDLSLELYGDYTRGEAGVVRLPFTPPIARTENADLVAYIKAT